MSEQQTQPPEGNLTAELRELGRNLTEILRAAWDQPERKRLQQEIANGLNELGNTVREETNKFSDSPTGQRLRTEAETVAQRVRSGEVEIRARQELLNALQIANQQIQRAIDKLSERGTPDVAAGGQGQTAGQPGDQAGQQQGGGTAPEPYTGLGDMDKGTDRSSMDPASEERREIHPDDMTAGSSDTGHREIHPDDVE
jgi:hypothetical protein